MAAMYRMKSHRTTGPYSPEKTSPFCRRLLRIAQGLSEDEVSQLKLVLLVDKHLTVQRKADLKNGAEVMMYLYSRNLISKTDTSFLIELLNQIKRVDLAKLADKYYFNKDLTDALKAVNISSRDRPISKSSTCEPFSSVCFFSSTNPSSLPSMVPKNYHHYQSVAEETLPKQIPDQSTAHLLYENTNAKKASFVMSESCRHEVGTLETTSSQSSQMSFMMDDVSSSQESQMSMSDDEKLSQIEKHTHKKTDNHLETFTV